MDSGIELFNQNLKCEPINEHLSNSPINIIAATFKHLSIEIPWSNLFNESITIKLDGLSLTLVPSTPTNEPHSHLNVDSLAQQYIDDQGVVIPGSFDVQPSLDTGTGTGTSQRPLLKSLINVILAKLKVAITNTSINLTNSENTVECKMASLEFGDVDLHTHQRKLVLNGVELLTHTSQHPMHSQMFMSAQESLHQTQNDTATHRILNFTNTITLTLHNDTLPTINTDIDGAVLLVYPSTISCLLNLIQSFPIASKTSTSSNSDDSFILNIFLYHLRMIILFDEIGNIMNEDDLWCGATTDVHIPGYYIDANISHIDITAPEWSMTVGDASVMASDSAHTFPLIVFDDAVREAVAATAPLMSDWLGEREKEEALRIFDHKTWKLLSTNTPTTTYPIRMAGRDMHIAPTHLFVDLAVLERFFGSDLFKALDVGDGDTHHESIVNSLLEETENKSADKSSPSASEILSPLQSIPFTVSLDAIRVSLRCPPPSPHQKLRSGILVIDVHDLKLIPNTPTTTDISIKYSNVNWLDARHIREPLKRITKVDASTLTISNRKQSPPKLTLSIPYIEFEFRKRELIGLQYLADDFALLGDRIKMGRGKGKEDVMQSVVELVRSRLVVDDASAGASASGSYSHTQDESMHDFFAAEKDEKCGEGDADADLAVHLDTGKYSIDVPTVNLNTGEKTGEYALVVADASDVDLSAKFPKATKSKKDNKTAFKVTVASLVVRNGDNEPLVESIKYTDKPALDLHFNTAVSRKGVKTSKADVVLYSMIINTDLDTSLFRNIALMLEPPPGVFENAVPSDVTTLGVRLKDVSVRICPTISQRRLVAHLGNTYTHITLRANSEVKGVKNVAGNVSLYLIDDEAEALQRRERTVEDSDVFIDTLRDHWKSKGYVQIAEFVKVTSKLKLNLKSTNTPKLAADILYADGRVGICADSLATFTQLLSDLSPAAPPSSDTPSPPSDVDPYTNLLASLDETAFAQLPDAYTSMSADLMDDDIPTNLEYAESAAHQEHYISERGVEFDAFSEGLSPSPSDVIRDEADDYIIPAAAQPEEKVEVVVPGAVMSGGFIELLRRRYEEAQNVTLKSAVDVTVHSANISLQLFEGYDWVGTRAKIEQEYQTVRRKLVKIRQLLSSGQQVDSADELSYDVYGAYSVGLSQSAGGSNEDDLLRAIDEELGRGDEGEKGDEEGKSDSEWQNLATPSQSRRLSESTPTHTHTSDFRKSLHRSHSPFVEIAACGVKFTFSKYAEGDKASSAKLSVRDIELLDRVTQKSKWRRFMTALQKDLRGNARESGSSMVELTLDAMLTDAGQEEVSLLCRILPLKLNIDQDALEFLKRFLAFKDEGADVKNSPSGPYIRQAIIEPVEIKMDYKPKHVNYAALRQGKTIELMNFFHFDGSEIILRKIMISGIIGWPRLFDLLQDTWTPDVKANQLSDVLSGVAPVRSLVNVGSGVADLVLLPIEQYRHDKRIIRGLQKGGSSFARNAGMEALRLGAKLTNGTQVVLEHAESILANRPSQDKVTMEAVEAQPTTLRQGMESAYRSLNNNLNEAAQTILAVPMEVFEKGEKNKPIIRAVPIAILKPLIGLTSAAAKIQQGFLNKYDEERRE